MGIGNRIISIAAAVWIATTLLATADAEPLRLRYAVWVGYGPLFVAQEKGFFEAEGVEIELIRMDDHTAALAALFAGQVDVLATATQDVVAFSEPDEELLACLLALDDSRGADGVLATRDITSIAGLKGKAVAYGYRGISQFYANVLLRDAGLSEADIEVVDLPADKAAEAFMLQEVDAAVTWEPWLTPGKTTAHGHLLTDSSQQPGLITDCLETTAGVLKNRRDDFKAVGRAWADAVEYFKLHPDEAIAIMAKHLCGSLEDPGDFAEVLRGVAFYDAEGIRNYVGTPEAPGALSQTMQNAIDIWSELGVLKVKMTPADVIAYGIVDE